MTSPKKAFLALLLLCLLPGVLSAFDISTYLYPSENNSQVSYTNFTLDGGSYSLVAINGVNSFLLQNGTPLSNASDIAPIIHDYYFQTYYPSSDQLANLTALIKQFNDSRNNGYDFKNKEEYVCRSEGFFNDKLLLYGTRTYLAPFGTPINCTDPNDNTTCTTRLECRNNLSCTRLASLVGGYYCQATGMLCNSVEVIAAVTNFSSASFNIDDILGNYTAMLAALGPDNVAATMSYIQSTAPTLKADSLKVQATEFRTPRLNDSADRSNCLNTVCYMLCPSLQLDTAATDQIGALAATLAAKVVPLRDSLAYASQLANVSATRLNYAKTQSTAAYYKDMFSGLNASGAAAIALGEEAKSHVSNITLEASLDQLIALQTTIPEDLSALNFTTTDSDMAAYRSDTAAVRNLSLSILEAYNSTLDAKNTVDSLLLVLQTKDNLDPSALETFGILQNQTADLDASFRDGYTVDQLSSLRLKYVNVSTNAQDLLNSQNTMPATEAVNIFRGFARRVNLGIERFAYAADPADVQGIAADPMLAFGGISGLVFLCLTSISLLFFLYLFVSISLDVPQSKYILGAAFMCSLVIFLGFGIFLYLFLDKTFEAATFTEFLSDFQSHNSTSIVVDLRNVSYADAQSMDSCATSLSGVFAGENKTWAIYTLTPNGCTMQPAGGNATMAVDACLARAANQSSVFVLAHSPQNTPASFSIIYKSEADISANSNYYESCPLVTLFG